MATKTLEELLSGGTLAEIIARQTENIKAAAAIFEKKDATKEETDKAVALDDETEKLQVKRLELEKVEAAKARTSKALTDLNTPNRPQFNGGDGGDSTKSDKVEFPFPETLKHFKGSTAAEANEKAFRFGKFLQAFVFPYPNKNAEAAAWCKEHGIELKVVQEATPEAGGVLVPIEFERTLIDLREQYGSFRANVRAVPMASETKLVPRRTGGLTAYFVGENQAGTTSTPAWDQVQLVAKKLMVLAPYSTEIAEDAMVNIADTLAGEIAYAFALKEDNCGFLGDGTSTYGGIRGVIKALLPGVSATIGSVAGIRVQATISTGTFASAVLGDFNAVIGKLPKYADTPRAKWYMHKTFFHNVPGALATAAGGNTTANVATGPNETRFLGYPVEFAQVLPFTWAADTIFALFGDLSLAAKMGDRRQTTLFNDPYSLSANDQVQIRGTERFDIIVHDVGDTTTPGPIVAFASAAS